MQSVDTSQSEAAARSFGGFLVAGAIGFAIDAGGTAALVAAGLDATGARLPAILAALTVTWAINRRVAFAPAQGSALAEYGRYLLVSAGGAGLNLLVYLLVVAGSSARGPMVAGVAVAAGSAAALLFNYLGYRSFAFGGPTPPTEG